MSDTLPKQRVWPVFVLAVGVIGFGFRLALHSEPRAATPRPMPDPFLDAMPALSITPDTDPVTLARAPLPQHLRVDLRQQERHGEHVIRTRITLGVAEATQLEGELRDVSRRYDDVHIDLESEDGPFGLDVAREVERLVATARHDVSEKSTGEVVDVHLTSVESAQLRQVLSVIEQVLDLCRPRLPREAVRPGEPWTWDSPVSPDDEAGPVSSGNMHVQARVLGPTDGGVAITMQLDGTTRLDLEAESGPYRVDARGKGTVFVVWDADAGRLASSDLMWEQHASVGSDDVTSTVRAHVQSE